jgi:hypothetical protein
MEYPSNQELMIFLGAFCIGLIVIALTEERPEVIIRWPTPKNAGLVTYLDRASNCYEYKPKEVDCDDTAKPIPIATGEGMTSLSSSPLSEKKRHRLNLSDYYPDDRTVS